MSAIVITRVIVSNDLPVAVVVGRGGRKIKGRCGTAMWDIAAG